VLQNPCSSFGTPWDESTRRAVPDSNVLRPRLCRHLRLIRKIAGRRKCKDALVALGEQRPFKQTGALVMFLFFHRFYPSVPSPNFSPAGDLATAEWQDFEYFRRSLEVDQTYSPGARRQAKGLLTEYQKRSSVPPRAANCVLQKTRTERAKFKATSSRSRLSS
jgi:hypothetical protein